ncbi:hypothetical protein ML514_001641 [Campylobacter coli]|uniref:hypothetical protein n=1 Tax=Campylobacter TaxID=194 RepID=UPI00069AE6E2|nr:MULTISPECIES: hypothetical protein [Campylobacter]EAI3545069.1 hypothetical protein [Campylobacter jejuni]EAJ6571074.1 hypothetical protein [Campylobacter jejuni]EAJ6873792.1 hypothetical protein [Campylobacter coli]EAJ8309193.1 hypothetical protein [Campylobacter coli]ECO2280322.1 hypothetical protein [Campylobacter coli]
MIKNMDILINILTNLSFLLLVNIIFIFIYDAIDNNLKRDIKGFNFIGNALSFTFIAVLSIMAAIGSIMFLGLYTYRLENF